MAGMGGFGASFEKSVFGKPDEEKKAPEVSTTRTISNREESDMPYMKRTTRGASVKPEKAKQILKDGEVKGKPLTGKQEGFFGARAGGAPMAPRNPPGRKRRG